MLVSCSVSYRARTSEPLFRQFLGEVRGILRVGSGRLGADNYPVSLGTSRGFFRVGVVIGVIECRRKRSAPGRIRTSDSRFRKPLLYPLSYRRIRLRYAGFSPPQTPVSAVRKQ